MKIATAGFTCVDNYANLDNRHYPAGNGFDALVNLAKNGCGVCRSQRGRPRQIRRGNV